MQNSPSSIQKSSSWMQNSSLSQGEEAPEADLGFVSDSVREDSSVWNVGHSSVEKWWSFDFGGQMRRSMAEAKVYFPSILVETLLRNDDFCIQNDGFCIQNDGIYIKGGLCGRRWKVP